MIFGGRNMSKKNQNQSQNQSQNKTQNENSKGC